MPQISICIVTYNRLHLFKQCIEAVLRTTSHLDREIIIWDNCSTDDTASFLKELESEKDIKVIYNDRNIGIIG